MCSDAVDEVEIAVAAHRSSRIPLCTDGVAGWVGDKGRAGRWRAVHRHSGCRSDVQRP
jgi:hypothetical protein